MENGKKPLVVMKFGGTSVGDTEKITAVAQHVKKAAANKQVVVVVSAMGHTTDRIIAEMRELNPNPPSREMDQAMHIGEIESAAKLASVLCKLGCQAISLTGSQMKLKAGGEHRQGQIINIDGVGKMREILEKGVVLVCAGFQGINEDQDVITLGRGGSDTTGVAVAHVLQAAVCEIYTDVDGVYAVDPRIVPNARRFSRITYSDMLAMSAAGAGVLMDRSVRLAQVHNVPLRVLLSPSVGQTTGGTLVSDHDTADTKIEDDSCSQIGLAIRKNVAVITINGIAHQPGEAARIYEAAADIMLGDSIQGQSSGNTASISFWIDLADLEAAKRKLTGYQIQINTDCVCLTLVGSAMKEGKGYLARLSRALGDVGVNIQMQATSGTSILTVIAEKDLAKAALAIALKFGLCQ